MLNEALSEQLPEKAGNDPLPFDLNIDSVSGWLERLPATDTTKTCTLAFSALQALNRQALSPALRFNILELLRPFIFLQSVKLETYFIGAAFPPARANRKIAKLSGKFHNELTDGYIKIVKSKIFNTRFPEDMKATVMHRTLQSISLSLLRSTQMYEPSSTLLWRDFYKLFRRAEKLELLDIRVDETLPGFRSESTPFSVLKKIVLFVLSNSYRYSQYEIKQHYFLLDQYAQHLVISRSETLDGKKADFTIDLKSMTPPHASTRSDGKSSRYLFLQTFTCKLTHLFNIEQATSTPFDASSPKSILKIMRGFGSHEGFEPDADKRNLFLIPKLNNIISVIAAAKMTDSGSQENVLANWLTIPNFELVPLANGKNNRNAPNSKPSINGSLQTTLATAWDGIWELPVQTDYGRDSYHNCQLAETDTQPLYLLESDETSVTPGDLVGLKKMPDRLTVGIVRWVIPSINGGPRKLTVEILSPNAILADAHIGAHRLHNIIFLDDTYSGDQPCSILIPPARYRSETPLEIKLNGKLFSFKIQKLLEDSPFFHHYSLLGDRPEIH